jgi:hypothetical protein
MTTSGRAETVSHGTANGWISREAITKYCSQFENLTSVMSSQRDLTDYSSVWYYPAIKKEFDREDLTTQTNTVISIETAFDDPRFMKALQIGHGRQVFSMRNWERMLTIAEQVGEEIARYFERPCSRIDFRSTPSKPE